MIKFAAAVLLSLILLPGTLLADEFTNFCSNIRVTNNISPKYAASPKISSNTMNRMRGENIYYPNFVDKNAEPLGLTRADWYFGLARTMSSAKSGDGRYCGKVSIDGEVGFKSIEIIIGSDIKTEACRSNVLAHEMRHFGFYNNYLTENLPRIREVIQSSFGNRVFYGYSSDDVAMKIDNFIDANVSPRINEIFERSHRSQGHIDSDAEYHSINLACYDAGEKFYAK